VPARFQNVNQPETSASWHRSPASPAPVKIVAGASHVGGKPVDFVEAAVDYMWHEIWITKIAGHEGISL
jgi:hypothetical protein